MARLKIILVAFALLLSAQIVFSQVTTSSITGYVSDENGNAVPFAIIVGTHTLSGTQYFAMSNEKGRFSIDGMRPGGPYKLEFSCLGYRSAEVTGVYINLADIFSINPVLKISQETLDAAVIVSETYSRISHETAGAVSNINIEKINFKPTEDRSIAAIARMSAFGGNELHLAGGNARLVNFNIDGANFNNNLGLGNDLVGGGNPISIDALEEVQIVVSPIDIRQTNFTVAGINAVTKSGTNDYKGNVYNILDHLRKSTTGLSFSGPIIKDKLFFFVNFETIYEPNKVNEWRASDNGQSSADSKLSRASILDMEIVSYFVKEKYGYDAGSYTSFPSKGKNYKILTRLDWNIDNQTKLAFRYNHTFNRAWNITNNTSVDGAAVLSKNRASESSMVFANSLYAKDSYVDTWSLNINSRISNLFHNEFLATYSFIQDKRISDSEPFPFIDILEEDEQKLPNAYISVGYELFSFNNQFRNNVLTIKDDFTIYAAKHKILLGVNFEKQMLYNSYMRNGLGFYRYDSLDDFILEQAPSTVCLTYPYNDRDDVGTKARFTYSGAYIQDTWSITDKLSLVFAFRYDYLKFNDDDLVKNEQIYAFDYSGNELHTDLYGPFSEEKEKTAKRIDTGHWPKPDNIISPRIGFAYDVLGNKKLTIRGGSGIYSGRIPLVLMLNMPINSGMFQYQAVLNSTGKYNATAVNMNIFSGGLITDKNGKATAQALKDFIILNGFGPALSTDKTSKMPSMVAGIDPDFEMPQVWKSTIAVDYKLPTSFPFSISAEAIFNKSIKDILITDWSIRPYEEMRGYNGPDQRAYYTYYQKYYHHTDKENGYIPVPNAYILTNTSDGYGYIFTFNLKMSPVKNIDIALLYTHTQLYESSAIPDDKLNAVIPYIPSYTGFNEPKLHPSPNVRPNRFLLTGTYKTPSQSTISFIYEPIQGSKRYSYMFTNDMNGDGYNYDLIYIPKTKDELMFCYEYDKERFWDFVNADSYLSKHKGEYAEAYSVFIPWIHKLDFRYSHDFIFKIGSLKNTIQLNIDILNILNFFNSDIGTGKILNPVLKNGRILTLDHIDDNNTPVYTVPLNITGKTQTWISNNYDNSYWKIQFGVKYFF